MHYVNLGTQGLPSSPDIPVLTLLKREKSYDILLEMTFLRNDGALAGNLDTWQRSSHAMPDGYVTIMSSCNPRLDRCQ
jgi:hypothetical protein